MFGCVANTNDAVGLVLVAACGLLLTASTSARAQIGHADAEHIDSPPSYRFSLRPTIGLGLGSVGAGARVGFGGEYWLSKLAGIGLEASLLGQAAVGLRGENSSATTVALVAAVRDAPRGGHGIFTGALGYARVEHTHGGGFCGNFGGGSCPEATTHRYDGFTIGAAVGWLAHPGDSGFEIGPIFRVDVLLDPSRRSPGPFLLTANLALGYALLR